MAPALYPFVAGLVARHLDRATDVLEVGCGVQQYRDVLPGSYHGLDLPDSDYVGPRPPEFQASVEAIPAPAGSFDVVFGVATFYQVTDIARAFQECKRVLRPGGRLLVFDYRDKTCEDIARTADNLRQSWSAATLQQQLLQAGFVAVDDLSFEAAEWDRPASGLRRLARMARFALRPGQWLVMEATAP